MKRSAIWLSWDSPSGTDKEAAQGGFCRAMRLVETVFVVGLGGSSTLPQVFGNQHEQGLHEEETPQCEEHAVAVHGGDHRGSDSEQVERAIGERGEEAAVTAPAAQQ